jgi:tRNA pseudouridine55 synthase
MDWKEGQVILIDKELEWTSFDVVKKIRNTIRFKKIGHAGTLDPLATGLLVLCTGKATKKIEGIQSAPKVYTGSFYLGATTKSFDLEEEVEHDKGFVSPSKEEVEAAFNSFLGDQMQTPPVFSAVKVKGKRAYEHARKGEDIKLQAKPIHIFRMDLDGYDGRTCQFTIQCSKGTYIRAIARDLGVKLGVGCYMSSLRRTQIGELDVKNALTVHDFVNKYGRKPDQVIPQSDNSD